MKNSFKNLPHLNQLYNQRKSYEGHRKRMDEIRSSPPRFSQLFDRGAKYKMSYSIHQPKKNLSFSRPDQKQEQRQRRKKSKLITEPMAILQHEESVRNWKSPFQKRKQMEIVKENSRLNNRIKTTISNLGNKRLSFQYEKFSNIRRRISKYSYNPQSHKVVLKCQKSLESLKMQSKISSRIHLLEKQDEEEMEERKMNNRTIQLKKFHYKKEDILKNRKKYSQIYNYQKLRPITTFSQTPKKNCEIVQRKTQMEKHSINFEQSCFPTEVGEQDKSNLK